MAAGAVCGAAATGDAGATGLCLVTAKSARPAQTTATEMATAVWRFAAAKAAPPAAGEAAATPNAAEAAGAALAGTCAGVSATEGSEPL